MSIALSLKQLQLQVNLNILCKMFLKVDVRTLNRGSDNRAEQLHT